MAEKNTLDPENTEKVNSLFKELQKNAKNLGMSQKEINTFAKKYYEQIKETNKEYKTLGERIKESAGFMAGLVGADKLRDWQGMVKEMVKTNSELHRSVINAGKGAQSLNLYKTTAIELSRELGATHDAANTIVKTLTDKQFLGTPEQISKAAKSTYALSRAFGISEKVVAENTVELQKWGQLSADTTTAMYADILKVAQANGLTKEGVQEVMQSTKNWSGMLKAFGKAPEDVKKYNMSLAKTVSALEKVGVSASTTTKILEDLVDPTNIEDNIPKYAALGISITDAITGNIDPDKMGEGLKAFGEKLKQMGPIAGAQYAKTMGVSYKDAIKAASADMAEASQIEMTPEEKAYDQLTKMTEKTKDVTEHFKDIVEKIGGFMRSFGPVVLTIFGALLPALGDKFRKRLKKDVEESVSEGSEKGIEKSSSKIGASLSELISKFENRDYFLEKEKKMAEEMNKEREKALLSMIKKGISAEQLFEDQKKENKERLAELNKDFISRNQEYQNNEEKILELKKDFEKKENSDKKADIAAKIKYLRGRNKAIIDEKANILEKINAAKEEAENIAAEEQLLSKSLNSKKNDEEKGSAKAKVAAMLDVFSKSAKQLGRRIASGISEKANSLKIKIAEGPIGKIGKTIGSFISTPLKGLKKLGGIISAPLKKIKLKVAEGPMGKIGAKLGGLAIVATIIGKILSKFQEPLELILDNLIKQLEPVFQALMPIITLLGQMLGALVKILMPPLLKILSFLLKAIGTLVGVINKKAGNALKESAEKMSAAAETIKNSDSDLSKSVDKNTDATKNKERLTVSGGQVTVSKGNYENSDKSTNESASNNQVANQPTSQPVNQQQNNQNGQIVNNINKTNKANEETAIYLKALNEKFDILIAKLSGLVGRETTNEEVIKSSVQAGVADAIKNNVMTVKPEKEGGDSNSLSAIFQAAI